MVDSDNSTENVVKQEKDWTQGSVVRNLWSLSWPLMIGASLNQIGPTIDMIWVGRLSSATIAGVGVGGMAVMMMNSLTMALCMGARAIIARYIGAGDEKQAIRAARQAYVVGIIFSLIMLPVGLLLAEPIMNIFGVEEDVVREGSTYLQVLLAGSGSVILWMMTESVMQSSGDSKTPMKIAVLFRIIHVGLCPMLIFGWWIFPELGVRGAALTNIITQSFGLILGIWILFTGRTRLHLSLDGLKIDPSMIWRIIKIGIPVAVSGMQRSLGDMIIMWLIVPFGTVAVAAHTVWQRVMIFAMMPAMGFGTGAAVLAGQNLGANQPDRAEKSGWLAGGIVQAWMLAFALVILIWAEEIIGIFGPQPDVVALTADFLRIGTAGMLLFGLEPVMMSVLSGVGDTVPPMIVTVGTFWVFQIPLAFVLSKYTGYGVYGVRWGMVIGMLASAVFMGLYFKTGRWKRKQV
ncbi:MAG: MATE family efflux transporter [Dehalococcoidales bacterium]|nr:MAG: MATE family efflux transporter [Dehalococcoidales bacterium]